MEELDREQFGVFLAQLRREKGLTQKELAEQLFVTDKAVSKWERGLSMPDAALLIPLAELLGVSVTELLRGTRMEPDRPLPPGEVEALVEQSLRLYAEESQRRQEERQKWKRRWWLCLLPAALGTAAVLLWGAMEPWLFWNVLMIEGMCLGFGAYFCFGVREVLPGYYDENRITSYSDGVFRMNLAGIALNNRNWPHIVRVCRWWMMGASVGLPPLCLLLRMILPPMGWLFLLLAAVLGFFVPMMYVAKKYE